MLYTVDSPNPAPTSHHRNSRVLQALRRLGPGLHPLKRIVFEAGLDDSTVRRILCAACDEEFVIAAGKPARYALVSSLATHVLDPGVSPLLPPDSALHDSMKTLQRQTAQVVLACNAVLIDASAARHCIHRISGERHEFQRDLERSTPDRQQRLIYSPLSEDAAGLAILAGLETTRPSTQINLIRSEGYAVSPSPLEGWHMLAVPRWHGDSRVVGSLVLLGRRSEILSNRREYALAARRAAADISGQREGSSGTLRLAS